MFECITIILVAAGLLAFGVKLVFMLDRKQRREDAERERSALDKAP